MKVSVIIPVCNVEPYLAECLDSVLAQTLRDIEVVCVDDGSTDGSGRMLDEYAGKDSRVKVIHQANAGVGRARNAGIDASSGEFIAFMDPDDLYPDERVLDDLYFSACESGVKVCGGGFIEFLPNGATRTEFDSFTTGMSFLSDETLDYRDWQFDHGYVRFLYSRGLFHESGIRFPSYERYQDPPFFVRIMLKAGEFRALRRKTYKCRVGRTRVDWYSDGARRFKALCAGLHDVAEFASMNGLDKLLDRQRDRIFRDFRSLFSDRRLRRAAGKHLAGLMRLIGVDSFEEGARTWDAGHGIPPEPEYTLRQRFWRLRHPEAVRSEAAAREAERRHREYLGDLENFGKAYADGMAELRYGVAGNA